MRLWLTLVSVVAVSAQGIITTYAGSGGNSFSGDGGPAPAAALHAPAAVALDVEGGLYIADEANGRIRYVDAQGRISTVWDNLAAPKGVCRNAGGLTYIADSGNRRVLPVHRGPFIDQGLVEPAGCALRGDELYIADRGAHRVYRWDGRLTPVAGAGTRGFSGDGGAATAAQLDSPYAVAFDAAGRMYISDQGNHRVRRVDSDGVIRTVAGNGTAGFDGERVPATGASLNRPAGIYVDQGGTLWIADTANHRIRRVAPNGLITTVAGAGAGGFRGDSSQALGALVNAPSGITMDASGALFIADTQNHRIRRITPLGPTAAPLFPMNGVVNAASFAPGLVRGGLVTLFGENLSPANGVATAAGTPWPLTLHGVSVLLNGAAARMFSLVNIGGREQISFLVPPETTGDTVEVIVENNGARSNPMTAQLRDIAPGIFVVNAGGEGAFLDAAFRLVTQNGNPASRGAIVQAYLTGLGPVSPPVVAGFPAPVAEPLPRTSAAPTVTVAGQMAQVLYSGLAPGFVGLYQVNFIVPVGVAPGLLDVRIGESNVARMAVR
jgi:uncharacterized protein (TIGR03437 family)